MTQIDKLTELLKNAPILNVIPERRLAKQLFDRGVRVLPEELIGRRLTERGEERAYFPRCSDCSEQQYGGCSDCGFIDFEVCERLAVFEDAAEGKEEK